MKGVDLLTIDPTARMARTISTLQAEKNQFEHLRAQIGPALEQKIDKQGNGLG